MSVESYVDSVRPHIAERTEKVRTVVDMLGRIVRNYAEFDDNSMGSPMRTPSAEWIQDRQDERVWLSLYGHDGEQIDQAKVDADNADRAVGSAYFQLSDGYNAAIIAMIIEIQPPDVKGYDGSPLNSPQLDGAIADMGRYEDALINGRVDD